jgi:hypothetical protein
MAKQAIAVRLRPETLVRVDAHAKARGVSRQVVLESAVESWLVGAVDGVVEAPVVRDRRLAEVPVRVAEVPDRVAPRPMSERSQKVARELGWLK